MSYERVPEQEINRRCSALKALLEKKNLSGIFLNHLLDLYYFTGSFYNGLLYIPVTGDPLLLVKKSERRTREDTSLSCVVPLESMREIPEILDGHLLDQPSKIGLTMDVLPTSTYTYLRRVFPSHPMEDATLLVRKVRMIKSAYEKRLLEQASRLLERAFLALKEKIGVGMKEREVGAWMENYLRREGHHGYIRARSPYMELFYGQVASGENGAAPSFFDGPVAGYGVHSAIPHGSGEKRIRANEPILVDYCAQYGGYIVDQTRVFSLGELPSHLNEANELAWDLLEMIEREASIGMSTEALYEQVLEKVRERGLGENFMGYGEERTIFIGHGVGLELDEFPIITNRIDFTLEEGMVFALEPKFVFPREGAVGIENTYFMEREGLKPLTSTPKDPSFFRI